MHLGLLLVLSTLVSHASRPVHVYEMTLNNTIGHAESTTAIDPYRRVKSTLVSDPAHSVDRTLAGGEEKVVSMQARRDQRVVASSLDQATPSKFMSWLFGGSQGGSDELQARSREEVMEAGPDGRFARASAVRPAIAQATAMIDQGTSDIPPCVLERQRQSLLQVNTTMADSDFEVPSFQAQPSWSPHLWAYAHRSCSQDGDDDCDSEFGREMEGLARLLTSLGVDARHQFVYSRLPEWIMNDPHWTSLVQPKVRGRGYWFWKPVLLNHLLEDESVGIPDGDWVVYTDGDSHDGVKTMVQGLDEMVAHNGVEDVDFLLRRQTFCELSWTTGDVFHRFDVQPLDPHYGRTQQYCTQAYLMQVNPRTRKFVRLWADLVRDTKLLIGRNLTLPNAVDFCEHREDQSLFSMLIKASVPSAGEVSSRDCWGQFAHETTSSEEEQRYTLLSDGTRAEWAPHPEFGIPGLNVMTVK